MQYALLRLRDSKEKHAVRETNSELTIKATPCKTVLKNATDYAHSAWCPAAECHNSDVCHPCRRRFLIVLATGRSGSTTLTYMLDSLPGVRMAGENNGQLNAIRKMIDNVRGHPGFRHAGSASRKGAWGHAPVPSGAYSCVAQSMMETINPPILTESGEMVEDDTDTIVGFKTIRFLGRKTSEVDIGELAEWITEMFPCAKFIVNIRSNAAEQAASQTKFFKKLGPTSEEQITKLNEKMIVLANLLGDRAILLDSNDWFDDINHLNRAVKWLGFSRKCYFDKLLEFNVNEYAHGVTELQLDPKCRYVGDDKKNKKD